MAIKAIEKRGSGHPGKVIILLLVITAMRGFLSPIFVLPTFLGSTPLQVTKHATPEDDKHIKPSGSLIEEHYPFLVMWAR